MLDELNTQRKVVGIKQLRKALKNGQIRRAYLALDADPRLTDPLAEECAAMKVELVEVPTMAELSAAQSTVMYSLLEVGLYARLGNEDEVLYKLFRMDESLSIEPGTDLTLSFYLTETILQDDQIQVVITPQGLVTQDLCRMIAKEEMQTAIDSLTIHNTAGDAHSALFASKAPMSHSHSASSITGGTLSGLVMAQNNVSYTTAQLRNITLAAYEPVGGVNGQIWIKYLA